MAKYLGICLALFYWDMVLKVPHTQASGHTRSEFFVQDNVFSSFAPNDTEPIRSKSLVLCTVHCVNSNTEFIFYNRLTNACSCANTNSSNPDSASGFTVENGTRALQRRKSGNNFT